MIQRVQLVVEEDATWMSPYGAQPDSHRRAFYSAVVTLTLGVLGSTILPVPYAFSKIGILVGILTMLLVASVNDATCCMLIRASAATGCYSYEELAEWAGGKRARVITQASLILLLYGTLCGGLAFLSDVARIMVLKGLPGQTPELLERDGRPVMVVVVLLVLFPLCLQRHIRQFEKAATVGVIVVIALSSIIIYKAVTLGFPAVQRGELPVFSLKIDSHLPEAFAVIGFAFYMQPMLMPLLKEMPGGPGGVALSERSVHFVLYFVACLAYGTVGVFGAAIYGQQTESNIMVNDLLTDPHATFALYAALIIYLCCGMVTTHYALRASVDVLLCGPNAPFTWRRQVLETTCIISAAMAVAITFPTQAEKIFALTGCTAVCLACYVIPVYIHLKLEARLQMQADAGDDSGSLVGKPFSHSLLAAAAAAGGAGRGDVAADDSSGVRATANGLEEPLLQWCHEGGKGAPAAVAPRPGVLMQVRRLAGPCLILAVGAGCSAAGLWVAVTDFYDTYMHPDGSDTGLRAS